MNKFTKEEISLCKQVAEKYREEVKEGSYLFFIDKIWLVYHITGPWISTISNGAKHTISTNLDIQDEWFVLWTISDCLEWLYEKYEEVGVDSEENKTEKYWEASVYLHREGNEELNLMMAKGKTPLEACLKVVLAVLEEEKNDR